MSGRIKHIVNECLRLIQEQNLTEAQMKTFLTALSLELVKLREEV